MHFLFSQKHPYTVAVNNSVCCVHPGQVMIKIKVPTELNDKHFLEFVAMGVLNIFFPAATF